MDVQDGRYQSKGRSGYNGITVQFIFLATTGLISGIGLASFVHNPLQTYYSDASAAKIYQSASIHCTPQLRRQHRPLRLLPSDFRYAFETLYERKHTLTCHIAESCAADALGTSLHVSPQLSRPPAIRSVAASAPGADSRRSDYT